MTSLDFPDSLDESRGPWTLEILCIRLYRGLNFADLIKLYRRNPYEKLQFLCSFLSFSQNRWILGSTVYLLWFDFFVYPKLGKIWPKWASKLNIYCFQKYVYWIPVILDMKFDGHDCLKCRNTKNEVFHFIFWAMYWNLWRNLCCQVKFCPQKTCIFFSKFVNYIFLISWMKAENYQCSEALNLGFYPIC